MNTTTTIPFPVSAPATLQEHYAKFYPEEAPKVFAWLHGFDDGCITEGMHVIPLYKLGFAAPTSTPLNTFAILACVIMANHNQDPWLYDRMGFHALAGIQELSGSGALYEFAATLMLQ